MIRKSTPLILISILASLLILNAGFCQTVGSKPRDLAQLISANKTQLRDRAAARKNASASETTEITLDLIFYRWASNASNMPADIKNIDAVTSALVKALRKPAVDYAATLFSQGKPSSLPPSGDDRVTQLADLKREFGAALDYRESSPILAVKSLSNALVICKKLQLDLSQALILKQLGDQYSNMTRYHEAEDSYSSAKWTFSLYDCTESCARTYGDYGALDAAMGRYLAAAENYTLAAQQWASLSEKNQSTPRYRSLAGREYMRAGDAQAAAGDADKALELMDHGLNHLRNAAYATKSYTDFINNLISVAQIYRGRGNTSKALDLLEEARTDLKVERNQLVAAKVYGEIAATYSVANQVIEAKAAESTRVKLLEEAAADGNAALTALNNEQSPPDTFRADISRVEKGASAYQELKNYAKSAETWKKLSDICKRAELTEKRISCLRSLATVLDSQGNTADALSVRLEAVTTARKMSRKTLAADAGREMVQALIQSGDLNNALEVFKDLASIFEEAGNVRGAAEALEGRGKLLARDAEYRTVSQDGEGARTNYLAALQDFHDARAEYLEKVGDPWAAGEVSRELAAAQVALERTDEARQTLESALKNVEIITENIDPTVNPEHSRITMDLYRALAAVYIHNKNTDQATQLLRKAKRYPWITQLLDSMKRDTDPLLARFAVEFDPVRDDNNSPNTADSEKVLAEGWPAFWQTCVMLKQQYIANYNALPIDPLDLFQHRLSLPKNGLVIEYMPTGSSIFIFACGYGKAVCREIGIRAADANALVSTLRKKLKSCEERMSTGIAVPSIETWQEPEFLEIKQPLVGLYGKLIAPIRQDIEDRQLLIFALPDEFAGLPVHALISTDIDQSPKFLIEDYQIGYLGDGMIDCLVGKDSKAIDVGADRIAVFADPQGNLPGAKDEAASIMSTYYPGQSYIGSKATVANFKKECERAGILHIAAHYKIDPNPSKFALELAPSEASDGVVGIEEMTEIANPHLELVTLSTCDSLSSTDPISSGPSRAAEAFSRAGAKSVLGGLWKVSDDAASKMMVQFYKNLAKGESRVESLRRAQLFMIKSKEYAHPFYWACFALYGNPK